MHSTVTPLTVVTQREDIERYLMSHVSELHPVKKHQDLQEGIVSCIADAADGT